MKTFGCLAVVAALAVGGSASAAERAQKFSPHCESIEAMKGGAHGSKFTVLTPGQFHYAEGLYVASPFTPPGGLPPGDGALLIEIDGKAGVVWTRGKQACITTIVIDAESRHAAYMPMPVDPKLMAAIKTGIGETTEPDDSADERKL